MYCANCGKELEAGAKFCASCGHAVDAETTGAAARPAAQAAAQASAQAPAKKKMATWKKVALGIVGFIVVVIALAFWLTGDLVDPIDRHLAALSRGDIEAAYAETSTAFRDATSRDQFEQFIRANPTLTKIVDHTFTERKWENNIGTVRGTLKTAEGGVLPVKYRLVKENDAWKILSIDFGDRATE